MQNAFDTKYTENYKQVNKQMFDTAIISPNFKAIAQNFNSKVYSNRGRYQNIANAVNPQIPWEFIAVIHARESDCNFNTHLYNGDPLTKRTVNEPKGLPKAAAKFGNAYTFEESAIDTLINKGFNKWKDWSITGQIYLLEKYNGFGYASKKKISPYLWSGTQFYTTGKFVADHVYSETTKDKQIGSIPLLKTFYNV